MKKVADEIQTCFSITILKQKFRRFCICALKGNDLQTVYVANLHEIKLYSWIAANKCKL